MSAAKLDLFLLRNRILVAERMVEHCADRVGRLGAQTGVPAEKFARAHDNLRIARAHLSTLRVQLADAVRPHLGGA